jgi:hypothetical protein
MFVRALTIVIPVVLAIVVSILLGKLLPTVHGGIQSIGRIVVILCVTTLAMLWSSKKMQRLLPLAVMLKLSWAFPDDVPSRFSVALRHARYKASLDQAADDETATVTDHLLDLVRQLNLHHRATRGHSERVRAYADLLGEELRLSTDERDKLCWAAVLHDIGKIDVPVDVLDFPGRPDKDQWAVLAKHPENGKRLAAPVAAWLGDWAKGIWEHHERWDGSGYPTHKPKERISLSGRIIAVADAFETMTAVRAYKKPVSIAAAREEVVACANSHFDPTVVRAFLEIGLGNLNQVRGVAAVVQAPLVVLAQALGPARNLIRVSAAGGAAAMVMAVSGAAASGAVTPQAIAPTTTVIASPSTTTTTTVATTVAASVPAVAPAAVPAPPTIVPPTTSPTTTVPPPPTTLPKVRPASKVIPAVPTTTTTTIPPTTPDSPTTTTTTTTIPSTTTTTTSTTPATTTTTIPATTTTTTTTLAPTTTTIPPSAPIARNDSASVTQRRSVAITVLANDTDADGDLVPGSVQVVTSPSNGTVTIGVGGVITYTAGATVGSDSFVYRVCDAGARCASATVNITVNFPPIQAVDDAFTVPAGVDTVIRPLDNDIGQLSTNSVRVTNRPGGVNVNEHNDGTITVRPAPGQAGTTKVLTYRVCTPSNVCSEATITLTVP